MNRKKTVLFVGAVVGSTILSGCGAKNVQSNHVAVPTQMEAANKGARDTSMTKRVLQSVSVETFAQRLASDGYTVIDVRTPQEYATGRLAQDAVSINFYDKDFRQKIASLSRDAKYLIYCRSGNRSGQALAIMKNLGFTHVEELGGGVNAWQKAGKGLIKD